MMPEGVFVGDTIGFVQRSKCKGVKQVRGPGVALGEPSHQPFQDEWGDAGFTGGSGPWPSHAARGL